MSILLKSIKTKPTRFTLALKIALLSSMVAFSSASFADVPLKEGITPATDASQIPAVAKLRKDTVVAGISDRRVFLTLISLLTAGTKTSPT